MINLPIDKQYIKWGSTRQASQRGAREFSTARTVATADTKLRDARATKNCRAALASFSQGYAATLTRHIETKAGVKHGLINYHFGSKQALRWPPLST